MMEIAADVVASIAWDIAADVVASIAWDIAAEEVTTQPIVRMIVLAACFLETSAGYLAVIPVIDLVQHPDVLQARVVVAQKSDSTPPPMVHISIDLGRHEDHFGEDGQVVLDVLTGPPALRVVLRYGGHEMSGVANQIIIPHSTDVDSIEWFAEDLFGDVWQGVLDLLAQYAKEIDGETEC